jgi:hypothetical protein
MGTAVIYPIGSSGTADFKWKWRCEADNASSKTSFAFYHDCLSDAIAHGYRVEMMVATGDSAPGGPDFSVDAGR